MSVIVLGSINMDLVARTPRLPVPGETVPGTDFFTAPGGKGANQAVACARLGVDTCMIGRVGDDVFGRTLRDELQAAGVDVTGVVTTPGPSGVAVIAVDAAAENTIIVVPGANGKVGEEDLRRLEAVAPTARVLLLQLEVPVEAVVAAARIARAAGVTTILDPAPAQPLSQEIYELVDVITPNESEAAALAGFPVRDEDDAGRAAQVLLDRGVRRVIVKMGGRGAYVYDDTRSRLLPAFQVVPVDTVAAGDAFNG
ncbi:MAG TPA: ribokinase, partial [Herpetosiphonaceae bacterium]|nr:ribokinase [Herpetosiphonaceae bacterium]